MRFKMRMGAEELSKDEWGSPRARSLDPLTTEVRIKSGFRDANSHRLCLQGCRKVGQTKPT
jgi:hypothetical protein